MSREISCEFEKTKDRRNNAIAMQFCQIARRRRNYGKYRIGDRQRLTIHIEDEQFGLR